MWASSYIVVQIVGFYCRIKQFIYEYIKYAEIVTWDLNLVAKHSQVCIYLYLNEYVLVRHAIVLSSGHIRAGGTESLGMQLNPQYLAFIEVKHFSSNELNFLSASPILQTFRDGFQEIPLLWLTGNCFHVLVLCYSTRKHLMKKGNK